MTRQEQEQRIMFAAIAPHFHQLTEEVLFNEVWNAPGLSTRDRSLITVTALTVLNRLEQLPGHLQRALDNGVSAEELSAALTHRAFYAGWPVTASALGRLSAAVGLSWQDAAGGVA